MESLKFLKLHPEAKLPARASEHAAGLDLYSIEPLVVEPGRRASVRTGLAVSIPHGYYGRVAPRSGLAMRHGLDTLAGVIDGDYRGEIVCLLVNLGEETVRLEAGARVAQLVVERIATPHAVWADALDETARAAGGFGSTGTD